jgi:hypothetical protein
MITIVAMVQNMGGIGRVAGVPGKPQNGKSWSFEIKFPDRN